MDLKQLPENSLSFVIKIGNDYHTSSILLSQYGKDKEVFMDMINYTLSQNLEKIKENHEMPNL